MGCCIRREFSTQKEGDDLPKIKEIITAESARNLLFVVRVIGWEPDHLLPLGAVVKSLPLGTTFFHSERILRAEHNILTDIHDEELTDEQDYGEPPITATSEVMKQVFTIGPSDSRYFDHALSLVRVNDKSEYTMAVLVSNIEDQLKHGSERDKRAMDRATSVYAGDSSRSMLPPGVCRKLSLSPNKLRDVIIVSANFKLANDNIENY